MNILCIINDGFEEIETVTPVDILRRAGFEVVMASTYAMAEGAHQISISNLTSLSEIDYKSFDLLLLPGGPQWKQNFQDPKYIEIARYFAFNKTIAAICASPALLGEEGLLKGKNYTLFPPMNKDFGGNFTGEKVVVDGNIITARGAGASAEFGFAILEYLTDKETAEKLKAQMYY